MALNVILFQLTLVHSELPYVAASLFLGIYLLLIPGYRLYRTKDRRHVLALFNRASYYPLALLAVVLIKILL